MSGEGTACGGNEWVSRASLGQWLGLSEIQLIPVSEEDDGVTDKDDEDDNGHPTPLDLVLLERPKTRPRMRVRMNSMHRQRRHLESVGIPLPLPLSSLSLLYSLLKESHRVLEVDAVGLRCRWTLPITGRAGVLLALPDQPFTANTHFRADFVSSSPVGPPASTAGGPKV